MVPGRGSVTHAGKPVVALYKPLLSLLFLLFLVNWLTHYQVGLIHRSLFEIKAKVAVLVLQEAC